MTRSRWIGLTTEGAAVPAAAAASVAAGLAVLAEFVAAGVDGLAVPGAFSGFDARGELATSKCAAMIGEELLACCAVEDLGVNAADSKTTTVITIREFLVMKPLTFKG